MIPVPMSDTALRRLHGSCCVQALVLLPVGVTKCV
jgi:hypothetical protein